MKKLVVSLLLSVVAANSFAMTFQLPENAQYHVTYQPNNAPYVLAAVLGVAGIIGGTFVAGMICDYHKKKLPYPHAFAHNNQVSQVNNNQETSKINWAPYAKIAAGLGLSALALKLAAQESPVSIAIKNDWTVNNTQPASATNHNGHLTTGTSAINNSFYSFVFSFKSLIPMIPAYFFLKSGFDDLKAARDEESFKTYIKEHPETTKHNSVVTSEKPSYV